MATAVMTPVIRRVGNALRTPETLFRGEAVEWEPPASFPGDTNGYGLDMTIRKKKQQTNVRALVVGAAGLAAAGAAIAAGVSRKLRGKTKGTFAGGTTSYDDVTLARKVESEIFRDADAPKGDVDVNAENGVVYLRGQVADEDSIAELERAAKGVDGVRDVESLLHTPGTPAPMKA